MKQKIFLAGAAGVVGRRLVPMLIDAGYEVFGTTRSESKVACLEAMGAKPVIVDVFDTPALNRALAAARPDIVINQLTDLPADLNPDAMEDAVGRTTRVRSEGTHNLVTASLRAGARRLISQSLAEWVYRPGPHPYTEESPLDVQGEATSSVVVDGVVALEHSTLSSPPLEGVVLRYGQFYGPGTTNDHPTGEAPLYIDDAAHAAILAIERGAPGIYNIAEETGVVSSAKARRELGWESGFRLKNK